MFSLIVTTYNEGRTIGAMLSDVIRQTRLPDEVVLVDGGSADDTVSVCEAFRPQLDGAGIGFSLLLVPGSNIACGRNIAIGAASNDCICVTDAGCRIDPRWCELITQPILEGRADLVGGFFRPSHHTRFQRILAGVTIAARPPRSFLPSSRSIAFTRSTWDRAGRYPEWLTWGEDTLFDERCLAAGARYVVAEDAIVYWEVRPSYRAAIKQFYRYAWGDGRRRRLSASHLLNTGAVLVPIVLSAFSSVLWLALFVLYVLVLTAKSSRNIRIADFPVAVSLVFGIRVARAAGYLTGIVASLGRSGEKV